jgi:hypothetical protein
MLIGNKEYDDVLFVHVPKTGGTSVRHFLSVNGLNNFNRGNFFGHDPYFFLEKNNVINNVFSFSIVRNPYSRAYSYYRHFNYQNQLNVSFEQFLEFVRDKVFFPKTPMIMFPQTFYLFDSNNQMSLNKVYKFENIEDFECDFGMKLPHLRKGNYNKINYYKDYTEKTISLVKKIYKDDFRILNYSNVFS